MSFVRKNLPLLFIAALSAVFWLPNLFTRGMFIDGLLYGLIGNNLAQGNGAWWNVHGVPTMDTQLWGNPPFHIWMLSFFYSVLGYHFWIDHFYSFLTAIITLVLIFFCTKEIAAIENRKNNSWWLACIAWLIFPTVSWSYSNNIMENTMTLFSTLSVLLLLRYIRIEKGLFLFALFSSCCIFIALITKGLPALFPLAAPLCLLNIKPSFNRKRVLAYTLIQFTGFAGLFFLVFSQAGPAKFLHSYISIQLIPVLQQQYHNTGSRFFIVFALMQAIIIPLIVLLIFRIFLRNGEAKFSINRVSYRLLFIGLTASLPIVISLKQSSFYLVPSLPLFALFFSSALVPYVEQIKPSLFLRKLIASVSATALLIAIIFCIARVGAYGRDVNMQMDLKKIAGLLDHEKIVSSGKEIYTEWSLKAYLFRDYKITDVALSDTSQHLFLLRKLNADSTPAVYHSVFKGKMLELYKK